MTDRNTPRRMDKLNDKRSSQGPIRSLSPSSAVNPVVVSSRHPYRSDSSHRTSARSTGGSNSSHSRTRPPSNGHPSIQMEPGIQALLAAEGRAAGLIAIARVKQKELMRRAHRESQVETEVFRREREAQYKAKLHEATQLEQFQGKLDAERRILFEHMKANVRKERQSLVKYVIHCVVDQIPVGPHPNTKRVIF